MAWFTALCLLVAGVTLALAAVSLRQMADEWYELRRGLDW